MALSWLVVVHQPPKCMSLIETGGSIEHVSFSGHQNPPFLVSELLCPTCDWFEQQSLGLDFEPAGLT